LKRRLLLFDIDGTLVDTGGAGLLALQDGFFASFPEHSGKPFPPLNLGGATDNGVAMFLFGHFGIPDELVQRERFFVQYSGHLPGRLQEFSSSGRGRILAGVRELLDAIQKDESLVSALLTGNLQEGAWIKLRHFGIDHHFRHGAFGDDHHDRNELGPVARSRAMADHGGDLPSEHIVVIGDTPKDVACARAFGAKVIAVATGASSPAELAACSPDVLLTDFSDTGRVLDSIYSVFSN
jgi:phosphoglycolate phosphatase